MKKIFLFLILIILIQCPSTLDDILKGKDDSTSDSDALLSAILCEEGETFFNGKCQRCNMEDHCIACNFTNYTCTQCALPYKLDGKRCKLSSKTITWIILMYLLVIVIVSILIVVLVLPKLN